MRIVKFAALALLALLIGLAGASVWGWYALNPSPPAAQLFINGPILTLDETIPNPQAVLVEDDVITFVGDESAARSRAPGTLVVHDLNGHTLMPGLIDAHGHFPGWGVMAVAADLNSPPIGTVKTIDELKARIAARAAGQPQGSLVLGMGYDDTLLAEHRHPTRADLDEAAPDHRVIITHISGHMLVASSNVLEAHGIAADTPDPPGGEIVRDGEGRPTGLLKETAGDPLLQDAYGFGPSQTLTMLRAGVADYLAKGVTLAQNGFTERGFFDPMGWASRIGAVPIRLSLLVDAPFGFERDDEGALFAYESDRFHVAGVKIITDGSIQGYTGYLSAPYAVPGEGMAPDYRGYPIHSQQALNAMVTRAYGLGLRPYLHGNGDAAIDMILDAIEQAQMGHPGLGDLWPVLIHAQMMRPDQIARAKRLKVSPSFFNAHVYYWGDRHRDLFLGPGRAARIDPVADALRAGLPFTLHLDTPVVPMDPWLMIESAVTRQTYSGHALGPDQTIPVMAAIKATTLTAAWQIGLEDRLGSITRGKWADLIVIDRDPRAIPPEELSEIRTLKTFVGGVERFSAD